MKLSVALVAVSLAGCLSSQVKGSTGSFPVSGASGGSSSGGEGIGASSSGGTLSGTGIAGGTTLSGTSAAGGTSGGLGVSSTGSTTGINFGTSGGSCLDFSQPCAENAACCSGECNLVCQQGVGKPCLSAADCSSENCSGPSCACGSARYGQSPLTGQPAWISSPCASDGDCCNGVNCYLRVVGDVQTGRCCNPVGQACRNDGECCNGNCQNGTCACLAFESAGCEVDSDCCDGVCSQEGLSAGVAYCLEGPGQSCNAPYECKSANCADGTCGTCSSSGEYNGSCQSSADCCAGVAVCGTHIQYDYPAPSPPEVMTQCCLPSGSTCDPTFRILDAGSCCGQCTDGGTCGCTPPGTYCNSDQGCCSGATCLGGFQGSYGATGCCQTDGQLCFSDQDCCSGNCQNEQCACVPSGGGCGSVGDFSQAGPDACCSGDCKNGVCL